MAKAIVSIATKEDFMKILAAHFVSCFFSP
jgi:hypothetical protein